MKFMSQKRHKQMQLNKKVNKPKLAKLLRNKVKCKTTRHARSRFNQMLNLIYLDFSLILNICTLIEYLNNQK
jgi:hypothetical protein